MKNRLIEVNKKFGEMGMDVPSNEETKIHNNMALENSFVATCGGVGAVSGIACIKGLSGIEKIREKIIARNVIKEIDKTSKNTSNIKIEDWASLIDKNSVDKLLKKVKLNKFSVHNYINNLRVYFGITKKELAQKSNFKEKYLEGVFTVSKSSKSRRNPSRDCILGICFGFGLNLLEANYMLKVGGYNELYLRNRKDLIVAKCLYEGYSIRKTNEYLLKYDEEKIGTRDNDEMDIVV